MSSDPVTLLLLLALALALYFIPNWIASARKHPNANAIFLALLKPPALVFLWLVVVAAFATFGVLRAGRDGPRIAEPFFNYLTLDFALFDGDIGLTVATCITASLYAVRRLRAKSITSDEAVAFVGLWSAITDPTQLFEFVGGRNSCLRNRSPRVRLCQ